MALEYFRQCIEAMVIGNELNGEHILSITHDKPLRVSTTARAQWTKAASGLAQAYREMIVGKN